MHDRSFAVCITLISTIAERDDGTMIGSILLPTGLGLLLFALAIIILLRNERLYQRHRLVTERHRTLGLPAGELVYEDADGEGMLLFSDQYPLVGKPDYVVKLDDQQLVPVELKLSTQNATAPYSNHILQLASYCLILEDYAECPPTHGILRYADREFIIDYTPSLRKKVIRLLGEMAQCHEQQAPALQKQRPAKCRACTFQAICSVGSRKEKSQSVATQAGSP
jgi:CRISPR-associated exonuclease Cas4